MRQNLCMRLLLLVLFGGLVATASAETQLIDAESPLLKGQVEIFQLKDQRFVGNGFVIGELGCEVLTPYHVAFGLGRSADGQVVYSDQADVGYKVYVASNLSGNPGKYTKRTVATVIAMGENDNSAYGRSQDMARLRLDVCFGPTSAVVPFDSSPANLKHPPGPLLLMHVVRQADGTRTFSLESNCKTIPVLTPGFFVTDCAARLGDSGNRFVLKTGGNFSAVGMLVGIKDTAQTISYGLSVNQIQTFFREQPQEGAIPVR